MATLSFDKGFGSLATGAQRKRAWTLLTSGTNLAHNDVWIAHALVIFVVLGLGLSMVSYPPPSGRR